MHIESLYRYPVKSLTPELLTSAALTPGRCIPWDRAFALAQGDSAYDPKNPGWVPKTNFLALVRNAKVAALKTRFEETTGLLTITAPDGFTLAANALTPAGQTEIGDYLTAYLGDEARYGAGQQPPKFHFAPNHSFCDHRTQVISLIGLGSLRALETAAGAARDKRQFRANIYIEGIAAWEEFSWIGKTIRIGEVTAIVQERIDRCAATSVNPDTAERDANPVKELQQNFGHVDLGIFAEVLVPGIIRPGDVIQIL
jgi:uncharacterized protein YcbX